MKTESFDLRQKGSWTEILETLFIWPRVPMRSSTLLLDIVLSKALWDGNANFSTISS